MTTSHYRRDVSRNRMTPEERERALQWGYFAPKGITAVRDASRRALAADMQPLVIRVAKHLLKRGELLDAEYVDLIQAGNMGLLQALASWDPTHASASKLATWAAWYITREMVRENARANRVPQGQFEEGYADEVDAEDDEDGVPNEYAASDDDSPEVLARAQQWDKFVSDVWNSDLTSTEAWVLEYLYWQDMSLRGVAEKMKISHTQVAEIRDSAIRKFRDYFTVSDIVGNYIL